MFNGVVRTYWNHMDLIRPAFLLFSLNLLDALLTIIWVRNGVADEANLVMAKFLAMGDTAFLAAKLAIGIFAATVFVIGSEKPLAKYGLSLALAVYMGLIGIHVVTGISAMGFLSYSDLDQLQQIGLAAAIGFLT